MSCLSVTEERWRAAQADELSLWLSTGVADGDDWNVWWAERFENYRAITEPIRSALEVGCGPFARNIRHFQQVFGCSISINDPLLWDYCKAGKAVTSLLRAGVMASADPLEFLYFDHHFDAILCINVLDHVFDVKDCLFSLNKHLHPGSYLILGQDLTNEDDESRCPEMLTDTKHPIRLDLSDLELFLSQFRTVFKKVLPKEKGRNPRAHHATLLYIGQKL